MAGFYFCGLILSGKEEETIDIQEKRVISGAKAWR